MYREESKKKEYWTTPENLIEQHPEADTLDFVRLSVQNCANIRVHNVDLRDQGFMQFAHTKHDIFGNEDEEIIGEMSDVFIKVLRLYNHTLQLNTQLMKLLVSKSINKIDKKYQAVIRKQVVDCVNNSAHVIHSNQFLDTWHAFSLLNDSYTFARMLRNDNTKICIFYGGQNHAEWLSEVFLNLDGCKTINSDTTRISQRP